MKIGILSRNKKLYSTRRIAEEVTKMGHEVRIIDYLKCHMNISSTRPTIYLGEEELNGYSAIIPRIGATYTFFGTAVVRQFEMMGVYSLNESVAISRSRDKLRSLQLLSRKGLGLPITAFAHDTKATKQIIDICQGAPLVIKLLEGTQGMGVILAETKSAAESVIQAFRGLNANILAQEYIKEAGGSDIRCIVVGDRVIASMKRQGKEGEFRSNLHQGGIASSVKITSSERLIAVKAAKIMGLSLAGVDLLRSNHGPVIMEVNSSPGLEGIELASKKNVANSIIKFIEKNAKEGKTRARGRG